MEIILAEDEPLHAQLTCGLLEELCPHGSIQLVNDGFEIIHHCRQRAINLLIADVTLNGLRGDRAIAHIRQIRHIHQPSCVILSTSANQGDINAAFEAGCDAYLKKSPDVLESRRQIEAILHCWNSSDIELCLMEAGVQVHRQCLSLAEQQLVEEVETVNSWQGFLNLFKQLNSQQLTFLGTVMIFAYTAYRIFERYLEQIR
ncbi:response regulator [Spirulina sp. CS-785/01]|uniref:response regulator n=1 Tax=Spirulina sp. CS-785/01 TaxID=3021716 RepID=UPI00232CC03D|nr:response regulator [Spirulina sp. CS-785/01]MDB9315632.1 response regulator [Spirulina sp. CS-785/01]